MRRRWLLEIDGRPRVLEADWDLVVSGNWSARIDGIERARSRFGLKWPGITARVPVDGYTICLVALLLDFDIDLSRSPGVRVVDPPLPPGYSPRARAKAQLADVLAFTAVMVLGPLVAAAIAAFASLAASLAADLLRSVL